MQENLQHDQLENTSTAIDWFITIQIKNLLSFVIFDIKDFYSSIKEKYKTNELKFAEALHIYSTVRST